MTEGTLLTRDELLEELARFQELYRRATQENAGLLATTKQAGFAAVSARDECAHLRERLAAADAQALKAHDDGYEQGRLAGLNVLAKAVTAAFAEGWGAGTRYDANVEATGLQAAWDASEARAPLSSPGAPPLEK